MSVQYYEGIGRRKTSTARVRISPGSGNFIVNGKTLNEYYTRRGDGDDLDLHKLLIFSSAFVHNDYAESYL